MTLRLRLTLIYTGLVSGAVVLLSIVIYSMVSVVMMDQVDNRLEIISSQIIENLRADATGGLDLTSATYEVSNEYFYQVWSADRQLVLYSDNTSEFTRALNSEGLSQTQPVFQEVDHSGQTFRVLSVPLAVNNENYGWLQVAVPLDELRYTQRLLQIVFGVSAVFVIAVAGVTTWLVTGQALEPLVTMAEISKKITSTDDLSKRIPVNTSSNDEVGGLVLTFNQTLVRLERLFNAQRRFLADVSHELRTPLTVIKGNVGLMRMMKSYDEESLNSIESEVDRLTRLVGDLLLMAQAETGKLPLAMDQVEIDDLLFEVFEQLKVLSAGQHDIRIENIEPVMVIGDRDRLKQVLLNLGSNAIKFTPDGKRITLNLRVKDNWVRLSVCDEGPGMSKDEVGQLFERFYRGDKARKRYKGKTGFGLGLPIAYWIVRNHGGHIEVETELGKGSTFTVYLPVSQADMPTLPMLDNKM